MTGIFIRYVKEWDLIASASPILDTMIPVCRRADGRWINAITLREVPTDWVYPLAGHKGNCERVLKATITGEIDTRCTCAPPHHQASAQGDGAGV